MLGGNDIVFLLGAGASKEAGLLTAEDMVGEIENRIKEDAPWTKYRDLYFYMKSALLYADGIKGADGGFGRFNIERLVNAMRELEKNESHTIYPFVGAWNMKLTLLAGNDFKQLREFRQQIVRELITKWVNLRIHQDADYYAGLVNFQEQWTYPVPVFSLNYDMCVEAACKGRCRLERGFSDDDSRRWTWQRFEDWSEIQAQIYLYKMHGSLDWRRDAQKNLTFEDSPAPPDEFEELEMIFGTDYKLSYIDPYLYFVYSFRKFTLEAKLLICMGYGFSDEHINGILRQAMQQDTEKLLLAVTYTAEDNGGKKEAEKVARLLDIPSDRIRVECRGAKAFLKETLSKQYIESLAPERTNEPF